MPATLKLDYGIKTYVNSLMEVLAGVDTLLSHKHGTRQYCLLRSVHFTLTVLLKQVCRVVLCVCSIAVAKLDSSSSTLDSIGGDFSNRRETLAHNRFPSHIDLVVQRDHHPSCSHNSGTT